MADRVLVIDDDNNYRGILTSALSELGYTTFQLDSGTGALDYVQNHEVDLVLSDIDMPGMTGLEVLKGIREWSATLPVIIMTGFGDKQNVIQALRDGANDFLEKPFSLVELDDAIRKILSDADTSANGKAQEVSDADANVFVFKDIELNLNSHKVTCSGEPVQLTLTEFKILFELLRESGNILYREELSTKALPGNDSQSRPLDVHINKLRTKLPAIKECLKTIRGVGYRLD